MGLHKLIHGMGAKQEKKKKPSKLTQSIAGQSCWNLTFPHSLAFNEPLQRIPLLSALCVDSPYVHLAIMSQSISPTLVMKPMLKKGAQENPDEFARVHGNLRGPACLNELNLITNVQDQLLHCMMMWTWRQSICYSQLLCSMYQLH